MNRIWFQTYQHYETLDWHAVIMLDYKKEEETLSRTLHFTDYNHKKLWARILREIKKMQREAVVACPITRRAWKMNDEYGWYDVAYSSDMKRAVFISEH